MEPRWSLRRLAPVASIACGGLGQASCATYLDLPVAQAPRLSGLRPHNDRAIVVEDIEGRRFRVRNFDKVEIWFSDCSDAAIDASQPSDDRCYPRVTGYRAPVRLDFDGRTLWATAGAADDARPPRSFETNRIDYVRIVNRDASRNAVIAAIALATGIVAGVVTFHLSEQPDTHDAAVFRPWLFALVVGNAAGAITLPVSHALLPGLGEELEQARVSAQR